MFKVEEYGEEFKTKEEAVEFLKEHWEWRFGGYEYCWEEYEIEDWIEERIEEVEEEE